MTNDGYVISFNEIGEPITIQHVGCGWASTNPNDIAHRYCGHCHRFLDLFIPFEGAGLRDLLLDALRWPKDDI